MDIKKLRKALADKKAAGLKALEELNKLQTKETLTEEEESRLAALEAEIDALEKEVETAAADLEAAEKKLKRQKLFAPAASAAALVAAAPYGSSVAATPNPAETHDFANIAEFARAVHAADTGGLADERLSFRADTPQNPHQERGGTSGEGHLVPPAFSAAIWELVFDELDLLTMADSEPTESNHVKLVKDETTPWGATGIKAGYRKELAQMMATKQDTDAIGVDVHNLFAFVEATDELLADAPRLAARLTRRAAQAIRWRASESMMRGTGVGELEGFLNSDALVTVAKESGQAAATFNANNAAKMFSRMLGNSIGRASWMINSDVLPQLLTMTLGDQPIWTPPASGFVNAPGGFLLGRPVIPTEHADTLGTVGDVQFVDMLGYYHTLRQAIEFAQSMHLYFDRGAQAFRWTFRHGGRPYLSAPVQPHKGSATKSHFVVLATRS